MAEGSSTGEKTEKPTDKRLRDAAEKGDVLQSKELGTALVVMAGMVWIALAGPAIMEAMAHMLVEGLRFDQNDVLNFTPATRAYELLGLIALPIGGIMAATIIAAIAAPAMLGSIGFRTKAFAVKPEKLNPFSGLKRIFGVQGLVELGKSLAKVVLLGSIGFWVVWDRLQAIIAMGQTGTRPALMELGSLFVVACLTMAGALFVIAGIDIPAQMLQRSKRLNMSKQDLKDEHKETEGSPELKGMVRRRQYEMLNNSVRKSISEASVVITNPTHFSVALRYRPGEDAAPMVVARGRGETALAIRELADEKGVPLLQYPELARAIYYTSRAGQVINEQLYMAVATVLAFVFRIENKMASEMDRPHIDVPGDLRFDADGRKMN
ncbi:EscU/YscU/HrcU family type III secretion system export apparatus switch protein [Rhizorhapis sp. SPR117]|uniref:EscU/YscU/HrcU family type III secretion system export apparatus switch protein n=1 Tax=Rhizorhapis sp. SPR117 TaxID=2912611 RepID=UPI001F2F8147|nr:flagellar type III secretion system protein FlhB [Rhizorhapis sp. SPR117]